MMGVRRTERLGCKVCWHVVSRTNRYLAFTTHFVSRPQAPVTYIFMTRKRFHLDESLSFLTFLWTRLLIPNCLFFFPHCLITPS